MAVVVARQQRVWASPQASHGSSVVSACVCNPPTRAVLLACCCGRAQITLVDQGERFIFKPLLYELLNGTAAAWEVAPTFAQLLAPYPIQFVQVR